MKLKKVAFGIILIAILVIAVISVRTLRKPGNSMAPTASQVSDQAKVKGPTNAKITLVEYSDFQCPACQAAVPLVHELLAKYPNDIQVVYRHFPLQMHLWSPVAHQSAECAHSQGKFWEYHDLLYDKQKEWSGQANPTDKFLEYAKSISLNIDQFASCLSDPKITEKVNADRNNGESIQIKSTPTFFLNGERLVGPAELKIRGENIVRTQLNLPPLPPPPAAPAVQAAPAANMTPVGPSSSSPAGTAPVVASSGNPASSAMTQVQTQAPETSPAK